MVNAVKQFTNEDGCTPSLYMDVSTPKISGEAGSTGDKLGGRNNRGQIANPACGVGV